jgi:DNA repair exonuclease SbcCD ATPase subunit
MIIRHLRAQRFGCLADCTASFEPGLNIVAGPNESGKSTLQRALLMALLDRPARRKANEVSRQWNANRLFQFEVSFETGDGRLWTLSKDYEESKAHLAGGDGDTSSWEQIQNVISGALGTSSLKVLQSTCCIAQDELAAISEGRKEVCRSLETLVTGGDADNCTSDAI